MHNSELIEAIRFGELPPLIHADILEEYGRIVEATLLRSGRWAFVPRGTFWMGGGGGKPGDKEVEIAQDFYLGIYTVTQTEWQAVMGDNPSNFKGDDLPVECVSWNDCQDYLERLNATAVDDLIYSLPTEAQWEYACRGAAESRKECSFDFYLDWPTNDLSSADANFDGNYPAGEADRGEYLRLTTKVGSYPPNRLGLYDMHGNVWEWCDDESGSDRVVRGGAWCTLGKFCRAADRGSCRPSSRYEFLGLGFRVIAYPR